MPVRGFTIKSKRRFRRKERYQYRGLALFISALVASQKRVEKIRPPGEKEVIGDEQKEPSVQKLGLILHSC